MKNFCVIGDPILHSLSPKLHHMIYSALNIKAKFQKINVLKNELKNFMKSNNYDGINITIPHKKLIVPYLDGLGKDTPKMFVTATYNKPLSVYGIDEVPGMQWYADCIFQKGWRFNSDINDPVNQGWIHDDGQTILAGIVYLTPDAPLDTGTSFYKQIKELDDWEREDDESHDKKVFYDVLGSDTENLQSPRSNIDSINQYRENIKGHSSCYESVMECKNVYNRLLAYDGSVTHGQTNYWMNNDDDFRLIQLFFISKLILPDMKLPQNRCNNYAI